MKIKELCRQAREAPLSQRQLRAVLRDRQKYGSGGEEKCIELKRGLAHKGHQKRKDWNKLLAEAVSMANSEGGYIIFGVGDDGELIGIRERVVDLLDPARIQDQLKEYSPDASLSSRLTVTSYYDKKYAALWVQPADRVIVFDDTGHYQTEAGKQEQAFKAGVVYTRDPGGRRRASQSEIDRMVANYVEDRLSDVVAKIEQVISVPAEADLVAAHPENPSRGYRLVAEGEGQPVRITSDPEEPAVPLREVFRSDVPYSGRGDEVRAQVRFWRTKPDHRVSRDVCFAWFLNRDEIDWDTDSSAFCFLSACANWGYPMFWARKLYLEDPESLHGVLKDIIDDPDYPTIEYVPYVAGAFFWERKEELFEGVENSGYRRARNNAQRIEEYGGSREFILNARSSSPRLQVAGEEYVKYELLENRDLARRLFDTVVEMRHRAEVGEASLENRDSISSAGHQLDLISYASIPGNDD